MLAEQWDGSCVPTPPLSQLQDAHKPVYVTILVEPKLTYGIAFSTIFNF